MDGSELKPLQPLPQDGEDAQRACAITRFGARAEAGSRKAVLRTSRPLNCQQARSSRRLQIASETVRPALRRNLSRTRLGRELAAGKLAPGAACEIQAPDIPVGRKGGRRVARNQPCSGTDKATAGNGGSRALMQWLIVHASHPVSIHPAPVGRDPFRVPPVRAPLRATSRAVRPWGSALRFRHRPRAPTDTPSRCAARGGQGRRAGY